MRKIVISIILFFSLSVAFSWNYVEQIDPFTDDNSSYIILLSDGFSEYDGARIVVRCDSSNPLGVDVYFGTTEYLGEARYDYRVGNKDAVLGNDGIESTSGTAVFLKRGEVVQALHDWFSSGTFLIRLYDYRGSSYTYSFNIEGWYEAFEKVKPCVNYHNVGIPTNDLRSSLRNVISGYDFEFTESDGLFTVVLDRAFSWAKLMVSIEDDGNGGTSALVASYMIEDLLLGSRQANALYREILALLGVND